MMNRISRSEGARNRLGRIKVVSRNVAVDARRCRDNNDGSGTSGFESSELIAVMGMFGRYSCIRMTASSREGSARPWPSILGCGCISRWQNSRMDVEEPRSHSSAYISSLLVAVRMAGISSWITGSSMDGTRAIIWVPRLANWSITSAPMGVKTPFEYKC